MHKKESPAGGNGRAIRELELDYDELHSPPSPADSTAPDYWLHVTAGREEVRLASRPDDLLTHSIWVIKAADGRLIEETFTCSIEAREWRTTTIVMLEPRGRGWKLHDGASDKFKVWRRPAPQYSMPVLRIARNWERTRRKGTP
jgi:hypothetical protein